VAARVAALGSLSPDAATVLASVTSAWFSAWFIAFGTWLSRPTSGGILGLIGCILGLLSVLISLAGVRYAVHASKKSSKETAAVLDGIHVSLNTLGAGFERLSEGHAFRFYQDPETGIITSVRVPLSGHTAVRTNTSSPRLDVDARQR
jgi:zinc transporter ZupT